MKRIIVFVIMFVLLISLVSCTEKKQEEKEYKIIEREILTPLVIIDDVKSKGEFSCMRQTPGVNRLLEEQIEPEKSLVESYRLSRLDSVGSEYMTVCCFETEADAKKASYRYQNFEHTKRLGAIFIYGNCSVIEELAYSGYEYPKNHEPIPVTEVTPLSVAGIVEFIEENSELKGGYYDEDLIKMTLESSAAPGTRIYAAGGIEGECLDIVHLTYMGENDDALQYVYIYEFELERDANVYETAEKKFYEIYDGTVIRFGNVVVHGNNPVILKIQ